MTSSQPLLHASPRPDSAGAAELAVRLAALGAARDLRECLDGLEDLVRWAAVPDPHVRWPTGQADPAAGDPAYRRLGLLVVALEQDPAHGAALGRAIAQLVRESDGVALYAEAGTARARGLLEEAVDRLQRWILPFSRDAHDLARALDVLLPARAHTLWFERLPVDLLGRLLRAAGVERIDFRPQRRAVEDALCLLSTRIDAIGLARPLRDRRGPERVRESPWYRLPRATDRLIEALEAARAADPADLRAQAEIQAALSAWRAEVARCRAGNAEVLAHLEETGVSAGLVFLIESSARILERMERLLAVLLAAPGAPRIEAGRRLLVELLGARHAEDSLHQLARDSTRLLARKVVERTAETGERYIARGRREYAALWLSSLGGGAIAGLMAASKIALARFALPPFVAGVAGSLNYVAGFVAMQLGHCTLATKQPAATAATLATILRHARGSARAARLTRHVSRIAHSQLAAALGNILAVLATSAAVGWLWRALAGRPFVSADEIDYVLAAVHPWRSGTALYAAWTGVLLWLSSLAAGWFDNWFVYWRVSERLAEARLGGARPGPRRGVWIRWISSHAGALAGNVTLGVLLGMTPGLGEYLGLPLDVRHVTLTTGKIGLCLSELGSAAWTDPRLPSIAGGIAVMFVLNLTVSFGLALWVASRASGVAARDARALAVALGRRVMRAPWDFLWPTHRTRRH